MEFICPFMRNTRFVSQLREPRLSTAPSWSSPEGCVLPRLQISAATSSNVTEDRLNRKDPWKAAFVLRPSFISFGKIHQVCAWLRHNCVRPLVHNAKTSQREGGDVTPLLFRYFLEMEEDIRSLHNRAVMRRRHFLLCLHLCKRRGGVSQKKGFFCRWGG